MLIVFLLSQTLIFSHFQSLKLGRHSHHTLFTKATREGMLKVGVKRSGKVKNETEHDERFLSVGDAPTGELTGFTLRLAFV